MNINFPSMQPNILDELNFLYNELEVIKTQNKHLSEENDNLKIAINDQNKKINIIHRLFNSYSKIVSENSRKIQHISKNNGHKILFNKIQNLENELIFQKISSNKLKKKQVEKILNNVINT
jgi:hypothetical protein